MRRTNAVGFLVIAITAAVVLTATVSTSVEPVGKDSERQDSGTGARPEALFAQVGGGGPSRPSDMARHTRRRATVTVSAKALRSGVILNAEAHLLNLFSDVRLVAMRNRVESRSGREYSWFGSIPGDRFGRVIINVFGEKLAVTVTYEGRHYLVLPVGLDGSHEVLEIDPDSFPEGDDTGLQLPVDTVPVPVRSDSTRGSDQTGPTSIDVNRTILSIDPTVAVSKWSLDGYISMRPDDGSEIDIIVAYTDAAAALTDSDGSPQRYPYAPPWNLLGRIHASIGVANQSFTDSGVQTRLNLVSDPFEAFDFIESDVLKDDLDAATLGTSNLAGLHLARTRWAADLVVLVTTSDQGEGEGKESCGYAYTKPLLADALVSAANGFLTVNVKCLGLGLYTLAHEVGHKLGASHDWHAFTKALGPKPNVALDAHGYVLTTSNRTGVRTIMAYRWECADVAPVRHCPRVGFWSDPDDFYFNSNDLAQPFLPLGILNDGLSSKPAHDVRVLNVERVAAAQHRASVCRLLLSC